MILAWVSKIVHYKKREKKTCFQKLHIFKENTLKVLRSPLELQCAQRARGKKMYSASKPLYLWLLVTEKGKKDVIWTLIVNIVRLCLLLALPSRDQALNNQKQWDLFFKPPTTVSRIRTEFVSSVSGAFMKKRN